MTSKEALEKLKGNIDSLKDSLQHYTMVDKDKAQEFFIKEDIKLYEQIEKDLEVLEILKKYVEVYENTLGCSLICMMETLFSDEENDDEFKKMKEWSEND